MLPFELKDKFMAWPSQTDPSPRSNNTTRDVHNLHNFLILVSSEAFVLWVRISHRSWLEAETSRIVKNSQGYPSSCASSLASPHLSVISISTRRLSSDRFLQTKNRQINLHNFFRVSLKESNTEDKEPQHRILSALPRSLMKPHVTSWHRWLMSMVMWGAEITSPAWNVVKSTFAGRFKHCHVKSKVTWRQKLLLHQHFPHD